MSLLKISTNILAYWGVDMAEDRVISENVSSDFSEELAQKWPEMSHRAAKRAAAMVIRQQRWEEGVEYVNTLLLTAAATLIISFPIQCLVLEKFYEMVALYR